MDKKIFAFVNINTKKGVLQTILTVDKIDFSIFYKIQDVECITFYLEYYKEDAGVIKVDYELSHFTPNYYFGTRIDDYHCESYSCRIYELDEKDIVVMGKQLILEV